MTPQSFAPLRAHCAKSVLASTSFSGSHAPSSQALPVVASSAAVYSGIMRCRAIGASVAIPSASAIMATPAAIRRGRWRVFRKRAATPEPAIATIISGIDTPIAKDMARPMMCQVISPELEATMIEVSTGPAHGTNAAPRTRPRPKPALSPVVRGARRAKGRSSTSMIFGTIMPMPTASSRTMPVQRISACGRFSRLSSAEPATVMSMNEVTRPRTMSTGRRVTESLPSALTAFFGASPPRFTPGATRKRDGSTPAFPASFEEGRASFESRPPAAPRKSAGRTGRMHGEMPVMKPPRRPSKRNIGSPYLEVVENARYLSTARMEGGRLGWPLKSRT